MIQKKIMSEENNPLIDPWTKRRYNLCYRARLKGYRIKTPERTLYRGNTIDPSIEERLNEYGFHVQHVLFKTS